MGESKRTAQRIWRDISGRLEHSRNEKDMGKESIRFIVFEFCKEVGIHGTERRQASRESRQILCIIKDMQQLWAGKEGIEFKRKDIWMFGLRDGNGQRHKRSEEHPQGRGIDLCRSTSKTWVRQALCEDSRIPRHLVVGVCQSTGWNKWRK